MGILFVAYFACILLALFKMIQMLLYSALVFELDVPILIERRRELFKAEGAFDSAITTSILWNSINKNILGCLDPLVLFMNLSLT